MKDSISNRIGRIIAGTANSIVSKIEGLAPDSVHEQAINELDQALDEVKVELGLVSAQKYQVSKSMARLNGENAKLDEHVMTAYRAGRKDLVESALARQTDIEDQLPTLEAQLGRLSGQEKEHIQALTGLIAKRNEIEDELHEFRSRADESTSCEEPDTFDSVRGEAIRKAEETEVSVSRVVSRTVGMNRSALTSNSRESAKLVELANLSRKAKIEAKLKVLEERIALEGNL